MFDIIIYDLNGKPIDKLYQYDTGIKIQIKELYFEDTPIVHFNNRNCETSYAVLKEHTEYNNGTVTVEIPSVLLKEDLMIYVYVYLYDRSTKCGRTIHVGNIPVEKKIKPQDYIGDPEWYGLNAVDMHYRITSLEEFRDISYVEDMAEIDKRIKTEISDRESEDDLLRQKIDTEITERKSIIKELDNRLSSAITQETSERKNEDEQLLNGLTQEISNRENEDTILQGNIDALSKTMSEEFLVLKSADEVLQSDLKSEVESRTLEDSNLQKQITLNKKSLDTLNGSGEGSISKQIDNAFNDFATKISDDGVVNTYKEMIDYAAENSQEVVSMAGDIAQNKKAIAELEEYLGTIPEDSPATSALEYVDIEVEAVRNYASNDATEKANTAEQNAKDYASGLFVENNVKAIFDLVYPVGSIYMSTNNVNPSLLFGGTWEEWGQGRVPIGVNPNDTDFAEVEKTGGEKQHTLSVSEMPTHYHTVASHAHSIPSLSGSSSSAGDHAHTITSSSSSSGDHSHTISSSSSAAGDHTHTSSGTAASAGSHKHSVPHNAKCATSGSGVQMLGYDSSGNTTASYINRYTQSTGAHTHSVSVSVGSAGSHSHTISSSAANAGSHAHTIYSSATSAGGHAHNITTVASTSGASAPITDSKGGSSSHNILQPYITCYMWKRVSVDENFF